MIPNFIWFAVPAPNDILRTESVTVVIDTIGSVCQVLMIFACWMFYYCGITNAVIILGLTIPPCMAFLFFAIDRKNYISIVPISIFTICHFIYGVVNYII